MYVPPNILQTIACCCQNSAPSFLSSVSPSAMPMSFFATSATLGKQRRRHGRVSCGGTDQAKSRQKQRGLSFWYAQPASSHASVPEARVFPEQQSNGTAPAHVKYGTFGSIRARVLCLSLLTVHPLLEHCLVRGNGLLPKLQELGRGQPHDGLRESKRGLIWVHVDHVSLVGGDEAVVVTGVHGLLELGTSPRSELDVEPAVLQLRDDPLFRPVSLAILFASLIQCTLRFVRQGLTLLSRLR